VSLDFKKPYKSLNLWYPNDERSVHVIEYFEKGFKCTRSYKSISKASVDRLFRIARARSYQCDVTFSFEHGLQTKLLRADKREIISQLSISRSIDNAY